MKEINWYHIVIAIVMGLSIGGLLGICIFSLNDVDEVVDACLNTIISTCNYANNLTDIVNLQSKIISQYNGGNFTVLDNLKCNILQRQSK
jgi:hypothetical protein